MDFMTAVRTCFSKYVDFSGRARRSEYWYFVLFTFLLGIVANIIDKILGTDYDTSNGGLVNTLVSLAVLLPSLAVGARRLHDTGRSGWWMLLVFAIMAAASFRGSLTSVQAIGNMQWRSEAITAALQRRLVRL